MLKKKDELAGNVTIGADPEFAFLDEEARLVIPSRAMKALKTPVSFEPIGIDGSGRVAELRPKESKSVTEVVGNLKKLLQDGINLRPYLSELFFKAGSYTVSEATGGHVHIGFPSQLRESSKFLEYCEKLRDCFSSTIGIISLFLENEKEAIFRRNGSGYGHFYGDGSWREQPWGMEWRPLGSWLTSPEVAEGILAGVKLVANACAPKSEFLEAGVSLVRPSEAIISGCCRAELTPYLKNGLEYLVSLPGWDSAKSSIVPLLTRIKDEKDWGSEENMVETWNLEIPSSV